jgi:hypothetical protein
MVAIPRAGRVQRDDKQVGVLQALEYIATSRSPRDCIAQRSTQPVKDGSFQEEVLFLHRLALKNFFN